ncbi:thiamine kinase [Microbulbifer sp. NBRC 101763]|uniref:choline kinase family protein n=1 Tax=unclassified Microbulbifer TaxID=2619833 RepID=UPI0030AA2BA1
MSNPLDDMLPQDWPLWSQSRPTVVRQLTGGQTNQTFLLKTNQELLILRINSQYSGALDLNRQTETNVLVRASSAGLCAPLVYSDPAYQYQVTRFIEGRPWNKNDADALEQVANLLDGIHSLPEIDAHLDISYKADQYWSSIDKQADFYPTLVQLHQKIPSHIAAAEQLGDGFSLCHNDLSTGNLIAGKARRLYAIDWEYAAMGDRFYDLAVIIEEHQLSRIQQQSLLELYLRRNPAREHWQRLYHWRRMYKYLSLLWYAVQWGSEIPKNNFFAEKIDSISKSLLRSEPALHI